MTDRPPHPVFTPPGPCPIADYPKAGWRWPNFTPAELACKDGTILVHAPSVDKLQKLRTRLNVPLIIHSAYRSPTYNDRVGGAAGSMHLAARAFDVSMKGHDPAEFERQARACGFTGFGFYPDQNFMHIDTGPARDWGERFPAFQDEVTAATRAQIIDDLKVMVGPGKTHPLKRKRLATAE